MKFNLQTSNVSYRSDSDHQRRRSAGGRRGYATQTFTTYIRGRVCTVAREPFPDRARGKFNFIAAISGALVATSRTRGAERVPRWLFQTRLHSPSQSPG